MDSTQQDALDRLVAEIGEEILARYVAGKPASPEADHGQIFAAGACRVSACEPLAGIDSSLASQIDHTLLKADATAADIKKICCEARKYSFASVCVNPYWVPLAAAELSGSPVKVCTVVGFPLGATATEGKVAETETRCGTARPRSTW